MHRRRPASAPRADGRATPLRAAIARTRARIAKERKEIRHVKAEILAAARAHKKTPLLRKRLHSLEWALHRDQHLLRVLGGPLGAKALKGAIEAERQAHGGAMVPKATDYPAPSTPPPAEKSEPEAVAEATAEAADPKAADVHDAEAAAVAPEDDGAMVSVELDADTNVALFQRPIFWFAVGVAGVAYWQRDRIAHLFQKGT